MIRNVKGSFTIEASLIFPVLFLTVVGLIFFSVAVYQNVILYQKASLLAEKAAFIWNNSYRDPLTGELTPTEMKAFDQINDGLYWRISMPQSTAIEVNDGEFPVTHASLSVKKLNGLVTKAFPYISGRLTYTDHLYEKKLGVQLEELLHVPDMFLKMFGLDKMIQMETTAAITDPVEFIRTVDLFHTYAQLLNKDRLKKITGRGRR